MSIVIKEFIKHIQNLRQWCLTHTNSIQIEWTQKTRTRKKVGNKKQILPGHTNSIIYLNQKLN